MACFLPFRPFDLRRALGSSIPRVAADESTKATILSCTSTPPRRVYLTRAADLLTSYVDRKPRSTRTSRKLPGPSAFPESQDPFFRRSFRTGVPKAFTALGMSRLRVWLPSGRVKNPNFLGRPLSAPNAPGLRFSELCLLPGDRNGVSAVLSALALSYKTSRPHTGASAACSHLGKPSPLVPPGGLVRVGGMCSLKLLNLSGSPTADP